MDGGIPMEPTDNETLTSLTDEQIERLAAIVFEDFGPGLPRVQFIDVVRLMFEHIAGFELMSQQTAADHFRSLWIVYRRLVASNRSH
jgi:hypothetical protein